MARYLRDVLEWIRDERVSCELHVRGGTSYVLYGWYHTYEISQILEDCLILEYIIYPTEEESKTVVVPFHSIDKIVIRG